MKAIRKFICVFAILCLLLAMLPGACADEAEGGMDALYKDKSWDQVVDELLARYHTNPQNITLGYYNTVTGEEHYLNPDQYMVSGSMYKVPLNMAFAEKVANGEMAWDSMIGAFKLGDIRDQTIIHSNNDLARTLWEVLSNGVSYHRYREIIAPLMGEDPETVDQKFYENNFFTARQMIYCLKLLYENPDRFPTIIETMQKAEPNNYFKLREKRFDIGHKYGYLVTDYHLYLDDCGVAFTDDPILLVLFSDNVDKIYSVMTDYCTLMCDYTQYHTAERLAAEKEREEEEARLAQEAAEEAARKEAQANSLLGILLPEETEPPEATEAPTETPENSVPSTGSVVLSPFLAGVLILVAALFLLAVFLRWRRHYGLHMLGAVLTLVFCALAGLLCTVAVSNGTLISRPTGDPKETVERFFTSLQARDFETAYDCLDGYATLGLEHESGSEAAELLKNALLDSYGWTLFGEPTVQDLNAHQQIELQYLDCAALEADTQQAAVSVISSLARSMDESQVYDEDNNYLPDFARSAYAQALSLVLSHAQDYTTTASLQLDLHYTDGSWRIVPNPALLKALAGGIAS